MNKKHILKVSPLVGAVLLALSAPVAMAAVTAPAAGSLPGNFSTLNAPGTTYSAGSSNSATITVSGASTGVSAAVLQWGGTTLAGGTVGLVTSANNVPATNAGFDIGANASLTIATTGTAPSSLLINDQTGNPSQIYGTLNASSLGAPLFIANGNGVILGAGGTINVGSAGASSAADGLSLVGFAQNAGTFTASGIVANNVVVSGGDVTVAPGSKIGAGFLLVAGAGNVNVGAVATNYGTSSAISPTIAAGYGFTETTTGGVYATGSAINTNATLTFNNASGTIGVTSLAAGNVNVLGGANVSLTGSVAAATIGNNLVNSGTLTVPNGLTAGGSFTNNGIFNASSASVTLAANGNGATLVNNGVVNMSSAGILSLSATSGGTVTNNGVINFDVSSGNSLAVVTGSLNVNLYGAVNQASLAGATPTALSATNALGSVSLVASTSGGVLNLGTTLYSDNTGSDKLQGAAVRVLSGGYTNTSSGTLDVTLGSGKVGNYGYNLSLFPGASLSASTANITGSDTTNGSNVNLFGTITGSAINVSANTINANSAGGFSVSSGGTLTLNVAGNVNNPNGAAAAGSSAFNYNFVPVTMQGTGGTLTVNPSSYASQAQFINVLVTGNATLGALSYATTNPLAIGANIVPNASYPNSHLVVSATGNLSLGGLYWPGMLYLANVSSASNPTVLSSSGTINFTGNVSNVIPTNVTSGGGIWFMTNKALGSLGTSTILTNTNSYVNFPLASGLAVAYGKINTNFYGAVPNANSSNLLTTQLLPSAYIYGR